MADTIRDVVVRIGLEQTAQKLRPPDLADARSEVESLADSLKDLGTESAASISDLENKVDSLSDSLERAKVGTDNVGQEMKAAGMSAGEGFKAAGEGAFTLARGIAFMSTSSEEDLAKMVATIAKVQGGFDIFKGGIETVKGLDQAFTQLAATAPALAAAMGPLAIFFGGVLLLGLIAMKDTADETADEMLDLAAATREAANAAREHDRALEEEGRKFLDVGERAKALQEDLENIGQDDPQGGLIVAQARARLRARQTEAGHAFNLFASGIRSFATGDDTAYEELRTGSGLMRNAVQAQGIQDQQTLVGNLQEEREVREKILEFETQKTNWAEKNLAIQAKALETTQRQLKVEESRVQSLEEIIGRMSATEFAEFQQLRQMVEGGGTLAPGQLDRLQQLGGQGVGGFVGEQFAQRGRARAGGDVAGQFETFGGPADRRTQLEQDINRQREAMGLEQHIANQEEEIANRLEELRQQRASAIEAQHEILSGLIENEREARDRLRKLERDLKNKGD